MDSMTEIAQQPLDEVLIDSIVAEARKQEHRANNWPGMPRGWVRVDQMDNLREAERRGLVTIVGRTSATRTRTAHFVVATDKAGN